MQPSINHTTVDAHLAKQAARKAASRNVKEEMVQFILVNGQNGITNDDLLRNFSQPEIDTHFEAAKIEARRRMTHQRAA